MIYKSLTKFVHLKTKFEIKTFNTTNNYRANSIIGIINIHIFRYINHIYGILNCRHNSNNHLCIVFQVINPKLILFFAIFHDIYRSFSRTHSKSEQLTIHQLNIHLPRTNFKRTSEYFQVKLLIWRSTFKNLFISIYT